MSFGSHAVWRRRARRRTHRARRPAGRRPSGRDLADPDAGFVGTLVPNSLRKTASPSSLAPALSRYQPSISVPRRAQRTRPRWPSSRAGRRIHARPDRPRTLQARHRGRPEHGQFVSAIREPIELTRCLLQRRRIDIGLQDRVHDSHRGDGKPCAQRTPTRPPHIAVRLHAHRQDRQPTHTRTCTDECEASGGPHGTPVAGASGTRTWYPQRISGQARLPENAKTPPRRGFRGAAEGTRTLDLLHGKHLNARRMALEREI